MSGTGWRGWGPVASSGTVTVRSARLPADADVRGRLFPKVHSWFALGAPLELLSPLSVMRVLWLAGPITWALLGLAPPWHGVDITTITAAIVTGAVVSCALSVARELTERTTLGLSVLWAVVISVLVWGSGHAALGVAIAFSYLPMVVVVAMYLRLRVAMAYVATVAIGCLAAMAVAASVPDAIAVAMAMGVASAASALAVVVLVRATRRSGIVDPDTGLPNGFGLARELVGRARSRAFVVAAVSLDGLGTVREALGYQVGTELIRRAVEDLGQVLPTGAVIGRVDGDELVVTYGIDADVELTDDDLEWEAVPDHVVRAARDLAWTLTRAVGAGRYEVGGLDVALRAHVGFAVSPWDGVDVAELIRRASISARRATAQRREFGQWRGDEGVMTARDLRVLSDLREAGARGELWLAYQPQVDASTGRTTSVEALLRWTSPTHGSVPPSVFIPLAERVGHIDRITEWVLAEALDAQGRWRERGLSIPVSVNLSARCLTSTALPERILAELAARDLRPDCLGLEVTETAAAVDLVLAIELLRPLHDMGVRISIDDFGVGYTSLSILPRLPLDELKVDQSFVMASTTSPPAAAIVRSVRAMAHQLGLTVVAEGVETEEIRRLMVAYGFDLLQGYLFSKPMPERDLIAHLDVEAAMQFVRVSHGT